MPKRTDLSSILIIGAGPIVIGQACEFDYSGTQACKALKGGRLPDHSGQFQSGDHHDRSGSGRCNLYRADHAGSCCQNHRERTPGRAAANHGRPDRTELRPVLARLGVLDKFNVEMIGADAEHRQGRRPRPVSHRHAQDWSRDPRSAFVNTTDLKKRFQDEYRSWLKAATDKRKHFRRSGIRRNHAA